jgi:FSR family fosmidomycin resistance protein-like MFS transporter
MNLVRDRSFSASAFGHMAVDLMNGQKDILLAALSVPLGLTNSLIGLISMVYTLIGSLLQPLFGLLADRLGARWVATAGILWMGIAFALAVSLPGSVAIAWLLMASLGSAAFHPAGTMEATRRARLFLSGNETLAASLFFLFGQGGLSVGPALGGQILDRLGIPGLVLILALVLPIGINAALRIPAWNPAASAIETQVRPIAPTPRLDWMALLVFVALRSWSQTSLTTFLPKYYRDLGMRASVYGALAALFMAGSAVGGVVGGWMGDRYDKRRVIFWTLLLAAIPLVLMPGLGPTAWGYLLVPLSGALLGATHSIIVVLAQRMFPRRVGAASGLVLGLIFASGSIGTLISGELADRLGFSAVFLTAAATSAAAAVVALGPAMRRRTVSPQAA